jgi:hypothetical protein
VKKNDNIRNISRATETKNNKIKILELKHTISEILKFTDRSNSKMRITKKKSGLENGSIKILNLKNREKKKRFKERGGRERERVLGQTYTMNAKRISLS